MVTLNKDGTPRKRKTCSKCHQPGHYSKNCPNGITWGSFVAKATGKDEPACIPSSSSAPSPSVLGSSPTTVKTPPPIDLSGAFLGASVVSEAPPPSPQATPQSPGVPPSSLPPPAPQSPPKAEGPDKAAQAKADSEAAGKLIGKSWVSVLLVCNGYVESQGGLPLGTDFLKMNEIAAAHLGAKYAATADVDSDDVAAGVCVVSGAFLGGQTAYFAYKNARQKKGTNPVNGSSKPDERATQPTTGQPTPTNTGAQPNGQGGARPVGPTSIARIDPRFNQFG